MAHLIGRLGVAGANDWRFGSLAIQERPASRRTRSARYPRLRERGVASGAESAWADIRLKNRGDAALRVDDGRNVVEVGPIVAPRLQPFQIQPASPTIQTSWFSGERERKAPKRDE